MNGSFEINMEWTDRVTRGFRSGNHIREHHEVVFNSTINKIGESVKIRRYSSYKGTVIESISTVYAILSQQPFEFPGGEETVVEDSSGETKFVGSGGHILLYPEGDSLTVIFSREGSRHNWYETVDWPPDSAIAKFEIPINDYVDEIVETSNSFEEIISEYWGTSWRDEYPRLALLIKSAKDIGSYLTDENDIKEYKPSSSSELVSDYYTQEKFTDNWFERFLVNSSTLNEIIEGLQDRDNNDTVQDRYSKLLSQTARTDYFRISVMECLQEEPDPRAEKCLRGCLFEDDAEIILAALHALREIGGPKDVYPLCLVLGKVKQEPIREITAELMADFEATEVERHLQGIPGFEQDDGNTVLRHLAQNDESETVRKVAQQHLDALESK